MVMHFMNNVYFIANATTTILMGGGTQYVPGSNPETSNLAKMTAIAGFCLAGLPVIVMGLWGAFQRIETLVRLYFWYMLLSFLVDLGFIVEYFIIQGPCDSLPTLVQGSGQAFSCGIARGVNGTLVTVLLGVQAYFIFIVWSYCEDLQENGAIDIADLGKDWTGKPLSKAEINRRMYHSHPSFDKSGDSKEDGMYGSVAGPDKTWEAQIFGDYQQQVYNSAASQGLGCERIFRGRYHEMRYPPPPDRPTV